MTMQVTTEPPSIVRIRFSEQMLEEFIALLNESQILRRRNGYTERLTFEIGQRYELSPHEDEATLIAYIEIVYQDEDGC